MQMLTYLLMLFLTTHPTETPLIPKVDPEATHVNFAVSTSGGVVVTRMRLGYTTGPGTAAIPQSSGIFWVLCGCSPSATAYVEFETTGPVAAADVYYLDPNNPNSFLLYCNPTPVPLGSNWWRINTSYLTWANATPNSPTYKVHLRPTCN